uniref:Uncharacterized protein LOC100373885 n=1 Tax=Saccoglossus kowalevskii TaxID=10224 RepID=A0ABM0GXH8_SACKO|nr:PREDICTED: uncharacterized protein LOC100373885 [Saccoglossus kowalevskii]
MDMNSPGVDSRTKDGAKVAKFSSRMDSLLATLKQDIKALRCQGDQVSETMWNLYQTFEDVLYERSTFLFSNEKISEESMEDGDSGLLRRRRMEARNVITPSICHRESHPMATSLTTVMGKTINMCPHVLGMNLTTKTMTKTNTHPRIKIPETD